MANTNITKYLLVEGNDDFHVISALCEQYKIPENFTIVDSKGIAKLLESIPVYLKKSGTDTIGIILDADTDLNNRWQSLKNILTKAGYNLPSTIPSTGLIYRQNGKITVGVWLMPDNNSNGMLEDFIKFLIPANDNLFPIAESTLNNIETQGLNEYNIIHKSKALIHTWLAWQKDPGTPMGASVTKSYLTTNVSQCNILMNWIKDLFK